MRDCEKDTSKRILNFSIILGILDGISVISWQASNLRVKSNNLKLIIHKRIKSFAGQKTRTASVNHFIRCVFHEVVEKGRNQNINQMVFFFLWLAWKFSTHNCGFSENSNHHNVTLCNKSTTRVRFVVVSLL